MFKALVGEEAVEQAAVMLNSERAQNAIKKAKQARDAVINAGVKIKKQLTKDEKAAERLAALKAKEDMLQRQKENAERKRIKKAQFAAKRRKEMQAMKERQRLRDMEKARAKGEQSAFEAEDRATALFESRTRTALVIISAWRNRLGRNRQRKLFTVLKHRIWLSRSFDHQLGVQMLLNAKEGRHEAIKHLLSRNADPNSRDGGDFTCLMHAAVANHPETVEVLLQGGADVSREDSDGNDALFYALRAGAASAASVLLSYGGVIDSRLIEEITDGSIANHSEQITRMVKQWVHGETISSEAFREARAMGCTMGMTEMKRSLRRKGLTYGEETIEQRAARVKRERIPPKRPNAITALGLLTKAEMRALKCQAEAAEAEKSRLADLEFAVTTKLSAERLTAMDGNEQNLNKMTDWLVQQNFHRSITPALNLQPKPRALTPLPTPPLTASKLFRETGHVRPEALKRLDPLDGRNVYEYEDVYQPPLHRSPSARRVRFVETIGYKFPRRDFNDLEVPHTPLAFPNL